MAEEGKSRVEKFKDQNYQLWKMQVEDSEGSVPVVGRKSKIVDDYEG